MPKMKTHKSTAKRFRLTGKDKLRRRKQGLSHLRLKKSKRVQQNRTGQWTITVDLERDQAYRFRYLCDGQDWRTEFPADTYLSGPDQIDAFVVSTLR